VHELGLGVARVVAPVRLEVVLAEEAQGPFVHLRARDAGAQGRDRLRLHLEHQPEELLLLLGRLTHDHRPLELAAVAPDDRVRPRHQQVAGAQPGVGADGVGQGGVLADLAAEAREGAALPGAGAVRRAQGAQHGERRLERGPE